MLKFSENPPLYLPADLDWGESSLPWRAAYTKPRQEKSLARDLLQRNVAYFLPMVAKETTSGGRRRRGLYPLFRSYLFFRGDEDSRLAVLKTERTVKIIEPEAFLQPELSQELAALARALQTAPEKVELHPRLVKGAKVTISAGPMKGFEGIILKDRNHKKKLLLQISMLGVGATLELPVDFVEPR